MLLVTIVVRILQGLILLVTRRDNHLEHFFCTHCPIVSTKSQQDKTYQVAKKQNAPKPDVIFKCKLRYQEFSGFYALR